MRHPIAFSDIKEHPTGHWGNASQINFLYSHIDYLSLKKDNTFIFDETWHNMNKVDSETKYHLFDSKQKADIEKFARFPAIKILLVSVF